MILSLFQCVPLPFPATPLAHVSQDDQVHFAHPIIVSAVRPFYEGEWSDVPAHGLPSFKESVPKPLIALIGKILRFVFLASPHHYVAHSMDSIKTRLTNG